MKRSKFQVELDLVKYHKNLILLVGIDNFVVLKYEQNKDKVPFVFIKGYKNDDLFEVATKYLKLISDSALCEALFVYENMDYIPDTYYQAVAEHFADKFTTEEIKHDTIYSKIDESIYNLLKINELELIIGDKFLADDVQNRVDTIRENIAKDTGFILQDVIIKHSEEFGEENYQIVYKDIMIASGKVEPQKYLLVSYEELAYVFSNDLFLADKDRWVEQNSDEDIDGITTIDATSIISLHFYESVKKISHELMTKESVKLLLNNVERLHPITVKDTLMVAPIAMIQKVLRGLLLDNVPIKDMVTILETITDYADSKNITYIIEEVRKSLSRVITNIYKSGNVLDIMTLSQGAEDHLLSNTNIQNGTSVLNINVSQINQLIQKSLETLNTLKQKQESAVLVVDPVIRKSLADIYKSFDIDIVILSHAEIETTVQFDRKAIIDIEFRK